MQYRIAAGSSHVVAVRRWTARGASCSEPAAGVSPLRPRKGPALPARLYCTYARIREALPGLGHGPTTVDGRRRGTSLRSWSCRLVVVLVSVHLIRPAANR